MLVKSRNFDWTMKLWSKIEILVENWNCGEKLRFWSKIEILVKNWNYDQQSKFSRKLKILSYRSFFFKRTEIIYGKAWKRIDANFTLFINVHHPSPKPASFVIVLTFSFSRLFLDQNVESFAKSKFWSKNRNFGQRRIYGQISECSPKSQIEFVFRQYFLRQQTFAVKNFCHKRLLP